MSQITQISNIYQLIQQLKNNGSKTIVVKCFVNWCGHCKRAAPVYAQLSDRYNNIVFLEVDMDIGKDIGESYGVSGFPTFLIFKNGQLQNKVIGADMEKLEVLMNIA